MPIEDNFKGFSQGLNAPIERIEQVSPNDAADLNMATRALNVTTTGSVRVTTVQGDTSTVFIAAGVPFPIRVARIWATGTTATGIVAMS